MVRSYTPKEDAAGGRPGRHGRLELVRNPHFHVWSAAAQPAGYPDRIVLETGYTETEAVARVTAGRADLLWSGAPPADVERLATSYGSQLLINAGSGTDFVFLNTTKPPFVNLDARRALAFALDRGALASDRYVSGRVTCQLLPPGFTAYQPYCPFTLGDRASGKWTGPDIPAAQALVKRSGTLGAKVVVTVYDTPTFLAAGARLKDLLDRLGYRASLRVYPLDQFYGAIENPANWNAGVGGWGADFPSASNFLAKLASCDPALEPYNLTGYCSPEIDKQIAAALEQQATDPARASDAWTSIDRAVVDAAAYIPFGNDVRYDFVSRRVGNTLVHPVTGPLIAQMWVL
jgi:peptide/nickel transport system substrate-binding protein